MDQPSLEVARGSATETVLRLGPTVLPKELAALVSALASCAHLSIRTLAFAVEVILEAVSQSTRSGLGLTRRTLVSAISAARNLHVISRGIGWASSVSAECDAPPLSVLTHPPSVTDSRTPSRRLPHRA